MTTKRSVKTPKKNTDGRKRSLQNLRPPWKPGECPNPGGRPKSRHFAEGARRWLESPSKIDPNLTNADALVEQWGEAAFKDMFALRELLDRAEGRPQTGINLQVDDRRRDVVERAIAGLMTEAGMTREEAIAELRQVAPDIQWEP
jgi:hypothetical protein